MTTSRLPGRVVPLLFLGTAHVALAFACFLTAWWPRAAAGFFYHSWMIAIVHLVTLGWITFSILGAIYIVGPVALQMEMPERRADYVAFAFSIIGLIGMVGHFWIQEYGGMAWSAGTILCAILYMTVRIVGRIRHAGIASAIKLHIRLACLNIWLAAAMGLLIAIDKVAHILPGYVMANVFAHAHLAAIGWATLMVVGVGYRLLPMTFPSKMPSAASVYATAILLEIGVLGLFTTLLTRSPWALLFAMAIAAGLAVFLGHVVWMLGRRVTRPPAAPRLDFGVLHAASAGVWLVAATSIGLTLLVAPASPRLLNAAAAYGVAGLVGFLAQMIVAMEARLLPMATWYWAYAATDFRTPPPSPFVMRDRTLQAIVFAGWTVGVPALASGMFRESGGLVAVGAWALFASILVATLDNVYVLAHARFRGVGHRSNQPILATATPVESSRSIT